MSCVHVIRSTAHTRALADVPLQGREGDGDEQANPEEEGHIEIGHSAESQVHQPLYVLPLYSLMPMSEQRKVVLR